MIKYFQNRFVLTHKGAKDFIGGIIYTTLYNLSLFLPAILMFLFLEDYVRPLIDPSKSIMHGVWYYVILGVVFITVIYVISRLQYRSTYNCVYNESQNRRIAIAEKLRVLPLSFFGEKNLSDLTSTIMDDNTQLEQVFSHSVPQLFASVITIILAAIGLSFYNWQLSLSLFWVVPIAALVMALSKKAINKQFKEHYNVKRGISEQIQEGIDTVQELKAYNLEAEYTQSLDDRLKNYEKTQVKGELVSGAALNFATILLKLGIATVIIVGANLLLKGSIDLLTYMIFLMVSASIYSPITQSLGYMTILMYLDVRIDRMREMQAMPIQEGKTEFSPKNFDIEFKDVDFAYESNKQVLNNVSFTAKQGEVTALVGPSGGGKSTSTKLAARFWDIDKGTITLGGEDISTIDPETLLKHYSVVFQDVVLFNASVTDNIKIGKQDATDEEIKRVAKLAQCDEFIQKLPNGYDTMIGENGETLSGGERQRISIARALLKDAPIILLDEATASLDVENETQIQAGISELIKNKTVLIIAHRMRTVANAHKIVVLKGGKVAEQGVPTELIEQKGEFAKMVERQKN